MKNIFNEMSPITNNMNSANFERYLLNKEPQDSFGQLDWKEIHDIAYSATSWKVKIISLNNLDWIADLDHENTSKFPPVVIKEENSYEVLDGKHRIGMAKARGQKAIRMWVGLN